MSRKLLSAFAETPLLSRSDFFFPCDHPVANTGFQYRGATAVDVIRVTPQRILHPRSITRTYGGSPSTNPICGKDEPSS
jgi:hypothetical protein